MLVARRNSFRVEAWDALKGFDFVCPGCQEPVVLKKGYKVVHHFAHHPDAERRCSFGRGESIQHQTAKAMMAMSLRRRGWRTEVEYIPPEDKRCRIDVITWPPHLRRGLVFEFQNTPIEPAEIFRRADNYAELGYAQVWVPLWKPHLQEIIESKAYPKYVAAPYERWIQGFNNGKGLWYYDPKTDHFRWARLNPYRWEEEHVDRTHRYEGYSKRWRELELVVSAHSDNLLFMTQQRNAYETSHYKWPKCSRGVIYIDGWQLFVKQKDAA